LPAGLAINSPSGQNEQPFLGRKVRDFVVTTIMIESILNTKKQTWTITRKTANSPGTRKTAKGAQLTTGFTSLIGTRLCSDRGHETRSQQQQQQSTKSRDVYEFRFERDHCCHSFSFLGCCCALLSTRSNLVMCAVGHFCRNCVCIYSTHRACGGGAELFVPPPPTKYLTSR
jgi:hypothetical protein